MEIVILIIVLAVGLIVFRFYGMDCFDRCYERMEEDGKAYRGICFGDHYDEVHCLTKCFNCPYYISVGLGDSYGKSTEKGTGESEETRK